MAVLSLLSPVLQPSSSSSLSFGQGYKFFVKATLVQVNGYAQCATTYWSPDGRDLSVNEVRERGGAAYTSRRGDQITS